MTAVDHAELKRVAEGATPGPWTVFDYDCGDKPHYDHNGPCPSIQAPVDQGCAIVHWDGFKQEYWSSANGDQRRIEANAAFIAAANPSVVLALLSEIEGLKAERDRVAGNSLWWEKVIGGTHEPSGEVRSIKHLHPAMVKPIYEAHKGTAVADVIAGLIFSLAITQNREQFLVADALERAAEAERQLAALRTQAPDSWRPDREAVANIVWERFAPSHDMDPANAKRGEYIMAADAILALRPQTAESGK